MKSINVLTLLGAWLLIGHAYAQPGKDGARTITGANTIVNEYTYLTADAAAGATTITVNNSGLNANGRFTAGLAQGDLVMIIQMQGANINATVVGQFSHPNDNTWGAVTGYNNAGNYEFAMVQAVPGGTSITLFCGLRNSYTAAGHVQVVRVPRYTTLNVNNSVTGENWNGNNGGIVAVEAQGNVVFSGAGSIVTAGIGFRGGQVTENNSYYGAGSWGSSDNGEGAPKGEGIGGFTTEYTPINAVFARGAPANAGGGGNGHNCGGGGGANAGNLATYTGTGVPNPTYNAIWNLETPAIGGTSSSGGGRGGNSFSNDNENAALIAPADPTWSGDYNRTHGGMGGRPLDYTTGRLFIGGGGGSGDQNDGDAGPGGRGGGMAFILGYGNVSGSGVINASGANGINSVNTGFGFAGKDGAGGAGGGGTVVINVNGTVSGISINANGGNGGNQNFAGFPTSDAYGPGGGGGGGYIAVSAGAPVRTANGGTNGTTNSTGFTEFPTKGATSGGAGLPNEVFPHYHFTLENDTICGATSGVSTTLTATVTGTVPPGVTLNWYTSQFATASAGTGTTFNTPALTTTTTYYVGFCPGHYRLPVTVVVSPPINISTAGMVITGETCVGNDGSITGITATGGTGTLDYSWNGTGTPSANLTGATSGNYTLTVTDDNGCTATTGPHNITSSGGPVINTSAIVITNATCGNNNGSISGITVSGGTGTLDYEWNSAPATGPGLTGSAPGSFTLEVTDDNGCTTSAGPFVISNNGGVTINTGSSVTTDATCGNTNGAVTGITATSPAGGLVYDWNGTITPTADLNGVAGGSYTLTVTDAAGCSAAAGPFVIQNLGAPVVNTSAININSTTCGNNNGNISGITVSGGTGTLTYEWNSVPSATQDLTNAAPGTYTLVVTDAGTGCTQTAGPFTINPSNSITASATGTNVSCFGLTDGAASGNFTGGNGGITYSWIGGPATQNYTGIGAGTYEVIVTDATGCADTASVTITEPASFTPAIAGTTTICEGQSTTLTASGGGTYSWSTSQNTAAISVSPVSTTTYTVDVTNGVCTETATVTVTVNPLPVASITGNTTICEGQSTTLTANGGTTYVWSDASTGGSITVSPVTTTPYFVVAQNACGADTATVNVTVGASFVVDAGPDQTIGLGNTTTITATGGISYTWSPPDGLGCTTCATTTASPTVTTTYTVTSVNASGCVTTDRVTITVDQTVSLFVPDIFAPNGNGVNDILYVRGSGIASIEFNVYDRWGQRVFKTEDLYTGWDGTFNGKPLDTGVFIYTLKGSYASGEEFSQKGNVTLKR